MPGWRHWGVACAAVALACGCSQSPCSGLIQKDDSVGVYSRAYEIQAVTVTAGPCSPLHSCRSVDAGSFRQFCGTYQGAGTAACTFHVSFTAGTGPVTCDVSAHPAFDCGVQRGVSVVVTTDVPPRCYDSNNDSTLAHAGDAVPADGGTG